MDAYAAGFIDADGCISISCRDDGRLLSTAVIVVQKEPKVLFALRESYGGHIGMNGRHYRWTITGTAAKDMLVRLAPHFVAKKAQAKLAIESISHQKELARQRHVSGKMGTQPTLTKEILEYRRNLWLKMKSLNTCHKSRAAAETKSSDAGNGDAIVRASE